MAQQIGLFGDPPRVLIDDATGSIVYYPHVLSMGESERLFALFQRTLPWSHETMWMYDRTVDVPRLIARFPPGEERPAELSAVQAQVENYLATQFNSLSVQYYRDGNDSVAWHNDHREELVALPSIALVSLGAAREMLVRSKGRPRRVYACTLEPGSLFVMAGRAQEFWEHTIPKVRRAVGPRISIALRQRKA